MYIVFIIEIHTIFWVVCSWDSSIELWDGKKQRKMNLLLDAYMKKERIAQKNTFVFSKATFRYKYVFFFSGIETFLKFEISTDSMVADTETCTATGQSLMDVFLRQTSILCSLFSPTYTHLVPTLMIKEKCKIALKNMTINGKITVTPSKTDRQYIQIHSLFWRGPKNIASTI